MSAANNRAEVLGKASATADNCSTRQSHGGRTPGQGSGAEGGTSLIPRGHVVIQSSQYYIRDNRSLAVDVFYT